MAYSSYGIDREDVRNWMTEKKWYKDFWSNSYPFFEDVSRVFNKDISTFDLREQCFMDIAASCQKEFEEVLLELFKKFKEKTKLNSYYSGGAALK